MSYVNNHKNDTASAKISPCRVIIIAGFLGSGKTTLLKRLIDWEIDKGRCPQVIMSEFGNLDIDSLLVCNRQIKLLPLSVGAPAAI